MTIVKNYVSYPVRYDLTETGYALSVYDLPRLRTVSTGTGVLYFWREPRSASEQFELRDIQQAEYTVPAPNVVQVRMGITQFGSSGIISLGEEGYVVASSVKFDIDNGHAIVAMIICPFESPAEISVDKSLLSIPGIDENISISAGNGAIRCFGTVSGGSKSVRIVLTRNPFLPVYRQGFNQDICDLKPPCNIDVSWKPTKRAFENRLLIFDPYRLRQNVIDELLVSLKATRSEDEIGDLGDFVIGDGPGIVYSISLVIERGLMRHVSDTALIRIT